MVIGSFIRSRAVETDSLFGFFRFSGSKSNAICGNKAMLEWIVPPEPTGGALVENAGPLVCVSETNVVLAGIVSVRTTFLS